MQEDRKKAGDRKKKKSGKPGKYAGYIRLTAAALVCVLLIVAVDSLRRNSGAAGNGELTVTVDNSSNEMLPEDADIPEVTEPSADVQSYEKKEIDENDFRPIVKTRAELSLGNLVMVNSQNLYSFPNVSTHLVNISSEIQDRHFKVSYNTLQLQETAMDALNNMMSDFYEVFGTGDVTVVTSMVSYQEQNSVYTPPAAGTQILQNENQLAPGYSEHHTGYAFDLKLVNSSGQISAYDGTGNYKWLNDNCYKYGFAVRYPAAKGEVTGMEPNPAHFRYVGVPHSFIMRENGFTLEEYMNWLKKYIHGYEHMYYSVYGYDYEIYFVPAEEEETVVAVPKNDDYSVSGNNCDGFIVTITRKSDSVQEGAAAVQSVTDTESSVSETTEQVSETAEAEQTSAAAPAVQN